MRDLKRVSKKLSYHLRHTPEELGIVLGAGGWVEVEVLLDALAKNGWPITRAELDEVVATNDKKRFAFSEDGRRIRASQGHSVEVDLQYEPAVPPSLLYHGTGSGAVAAIKHNGLLKMARHHVHLSADYETARAVGARHGRPAVFVVHADAMVADGAVFYRSDNGVWLIENVASKYLTLQEG